MNKRVFITGTDTDVGKTLVTSALIKLASQQHKSIIALKPISAGCDLIDGELKNEDALQLMASMEQQYDYHLINPIALKPPIAPHLAAKEIGFELTVKTLQEKIKLKNFKQEILLIEGAGGWLVPLNESETLADWVEEEQLEVVLVVGMKLGCINHAILTVENIKKRGLKLIGWIANCVDPNMLYLDENIQSLKAIIVEPQLATIPFLEKKENVTQYLSKFSF